MPLGSASRPQRILWFDSSPPLALARVAARAAGSMELDPPSALSFALGAVVMIGGVLAPLGYVFVSNNKALMKRG